MSKAPRKAIRFANHGVSAATHKLKPRSREGRAQAYVRAAADKLGLRDWDIALAPDKTPDDGSHASVTISEGQHVELCLEPTFWDRDPEWQRLVICHELCHLHLYELGASVHRLESVLSAQAYKVAVAHTHDAEEHAVQAFARLLSTLLPLPKF